MKYQDIVDEIIAEEFEMHMLDPKGMSEEVRAQLKKQHKTVIGFNIFQIKAISEVVELLYKKYTNYINKRIVQNKERIDTEAFFEGLSYLMQYTTTEKYMNKLTEAYHKLLEDKNGIPKSRNIKH